MLPCHAMPPSQPDEVEIAFSVVDNPFTRPCLMTLDAQNLPSREHLRSTRKRTAVTGILEICTTGRYFVLVPRYSRIAVRNDRTFSIQLRLSDAFNNRVSFTLYANLAF